MAVPGEVRGESYIGESGVTESVREIMARDARLPRGAFAPQAKVEREVPFEKVQDPSSLAVASWPPSEAATSTFRTVEPRAPQTIGTSILAIQGPGAESPYVPPDSVGDVGPSQVLVGANGRIKVFDKSGTLGVLNTTMNNFFSSVGGSVGTSDPHVRYDRLSGRWFVVIITVNECPNKVLIAVSSGPTIDSSSTFTFFSFTPETTFVDYPTLGVDKNALYIGGNIFTCPGSFTGVSAYVVRKADLLTGSAVVTIFRGLDGAGIWTPQGVDDDDPGATEGYFVGVDFNLFGRLGIRRISDPGGTPTMSSQINVTVPTTSFPLAQPQPSPGPALDGLDDRLFAAAIHKNKITGALTLWTAHNISVDASGVASSGDRNASRWYEIGDLGGTPTLLQSGTLFDSAATTPFGYWIPSIVMSGQGHAAMAASRASTAASDGFAGISTAGRLRGDAAGTLEAVVLAQGSTFSYDTFVTGTERWGDYSQTVVDPADDQTIWTFQEYASATNTWGVRAIKLGAPPPATPASASPSSVAAGQASLSVVITGSSVGGSEFFDPGPDAGGPGFASHLTASVDGGVTVSSVSFDSPTQLTLSLSTVGASAGARNVTIINPDGQSRVGTGILGITSTGTCPVISVSPSSLPGGAIGTPYSQTFTQSGGTGTITWSVTGTLPTGVTLDPSTGVLAGTPTQAGSFPITAVATDANGCQGSVAVTLAVAGCPVITVGPSTIPAGTAGTAYSQTFTQTGAAGTITWSVTGTLPTGVSLSAATGVLSGTPLDAGSFPITVTATEASTCQGSASVTLLVNPGGPGAPFGSFDTPVNGATGLAGAIAVTGWALDDVQVTKVQIYRNPVSGEPTQPNGHVYIADATFVPGARPDVESAYPSYPFANRAGWGYMLLTNFFPPNSGNGTYTLYAYAVDGLDQTTLLGQKTVTIDNLNSTKPFGTLDTPGQGQTVSGTIVVFGWALTPQPAVIPTDGSTIWLTIDNMYISHPTYNQYRADIAGAFPGYANSNGAVGYSVIDTTTLTNGIHTIGWLVTDDLARTEGLGSRFFWVQN